MSKSSKDKRLVSVAELKEKYHYKNELVSLCRKTGIPSSGTKMELNERLLHYAETGEIIDVEKEKSSSRKEINKLITTDTDFIKAGLKFDHRFRKFIQDYTGDKKVSFTKYMGAAVRKAKKENQILKVCDLIIIYKTPKEEQPELEEEHTYQWNRFVKDFTQSEDSNKYKNKLKAAAVLWAQVRDSRDAKVFSSDLLIKYSDLIKYYLKDSNSNFE